MKRKHASLRRLELAPLMGTLLLFLACGSVSTAVDAAAGGAGGGGSGGTSSDAGQEQTTTDSGSTAGSGGSSGSGGAVGGRGGAGGAACNVSTSIPYCASCRDARGVCLCGALPCCDQTCQS
jgi:hypothetical protein